ncbi:MAG: winged helix-turn-helix domain-containing protein [Candidatus Nitrosopolaris sp.]|nr:winged helix-turn-helix domain-containing protein [Candidatus Eisenbacteria bacterium]
MRQEKRHKLQLFYDIISAVEDNMINSESARPTHVQHYSRLSYDKMLNYVDELEKRGMIFRDSNGLISVTEKGREFTRHYSQLMNLIESAGL